MSRTPTLVGALALLTFTTALSPSTAIALWSKSDAKPVAELDLMDDGELAYEALDACIHMAQARAALKTGLILADREAASNYLDTVYRVLRKKHGGKAPPWMADMFTAAGSADADQCGKAFDSYINAEKKKRAKQPRKQRTP